ncbi:FHA domain-containing serine/threonine-protein kinase [Candidatus Magnetomonas plexicatena]|uniref:FHA domain-containing serine/threonine-protein kinase n=1 Tax=Candidatus Magnetomonas plexicatena TaxID=2552947 RepID=UPI001C78F399|nr:protein kinase [Nitrospirales bacterium LBB_01]
MKVTLDVTAGPNTGERFIFTESDTFLVGRSRKAHLRLNKKDDLFISRTHFILEIRRNICYITDINSTNGTLVNDKRIDRAELHDDDEITIGNTKILVHIDQDDTQRYHYVFCSACKENVDHEVDESVPQNEREFMAYTCRSCRALEEERKVSKKHTDSHKHYTCVSCNTDMTDAANYDGRAAEFEDSIYLCTNCEWKWRTKTPTFEAGDAYVVLSIIGRGAMGTVYKVVEVNTRRVYALKRVNIDGKKNSSGLKLFAREMEIQSRLNHKNLIKYLDRGEAGNMPFLVSEFMPGGDLGKLIKMTLKGPLPPQYACKIIIQVLNGLQFIHLNGYVHRDLKPSNFLLNRAYTDTGLTIKITDYGLAKSYEEAGNSLYDFTQTGTFGGSLMFLSPEQITNYKFVKPPSDIYSVGVSLYYMLTAKYTVKYPPESSRSGKKWRHPLDMVLEDAPIPILERNKDLPDALAAVVDKSVTKDEYKRFQSASEFREALCEAIDGL